MSAPWRAAMLFGTEEKPAESRILRAGPLSTVLEDGNLRAIRWHGVEAIRAVSYLVRDENWGTYAPVIEGLSVEEGAARFTVSYRGTCAASSGGVLRFEATVTGEASGKLVFDVSAVPDADFSTNRTGFNILHPIVGVAGQPVTVEHTDGAVERSTFPAQIDPAQPFMAMRRITHELAPGATASVLMEGDTFEMEDQRNWTDASFKTYVRPLALPWPYTLPAGEALRQTITVTLDGVPEASGAGGAGPVQIRVGDETGVVHPSLGLVVKPEETAATLQALDHLKALGPRHLIFSFDPLQGHGQAALDGFHQLLHAYPVPATLELTLPAKRAPADELAEAARMVEKAGLRLDAVAVSPAPDLKSTPPGSRWPDCPPLDEIYHAARETFPGLRLGGGMFSYFTELNRKRVPAELLDFITHSTAPIVHAADDESVMQTLEALPFVTQSVRAIFGDKPYRVGPSTIGMRHNPYGAALRPSDGRSRKTMVPEDPRQGGLFAGAWTVGYAAATLSAGLEALTLGALTGPFGAVEDGGLRPVFHALRAVAALSGQPARAVEMNGAGAAGLAAGSTLVLANLRPEPVELEVEGLEAFARVDETVWDALSRSAELPRESSDRRFSLGAYGVAICSTR